MASCALCIRFGGKRIRLFRGCARRSAKWLDCSALVFGGHPLWAGAIMGSLDTSCLDIDVYSSLDPCVDELESASSCTYFFDGLTSVRGLSYIGAQGGLSIHERKHVQHSAGSAYAGGPSRS